MPAPKKHRDKKTVARKEGGNHIRQVEPLTVADVECPRCQSRFHCNAANIEQCQCWGVGLESQDFAYLQQLGFSAEETGCLCRNCLLDIKKQVRNSS
mgnify:CR=1 FL=1